MRMKALVGSALLVRIRTQLCSGTFARMHSCKQNLQSPGGTWTCQPVCKRAVCKSKATLCKAIVLHRLAASQMPQHLVVGTA